MIEDVNKSYGVAKSLYRHITTLKNEQLQRDFGESQNTTYFETAKIQTFSKPRNVCLSKTFDGDGCLKQIYTGLSTYIAYLPYVERENLTAAVIIDVKHLTTRLLNHIKDKLKDGWDHTLNVPTLPQGSAWTRKMVTYSILSNFENFMKDTCRAIYFINIKPKYVRMLGGKVPHNVV
uniref:Interleukin-6 n=2 Tax=Electrophorus electricus TaxID=8005 RepID=A0A4W4EG61_ELEEL